MADLLEFNERLVRAVGYGLPGFPSARASRYSAVGVKGLENSWLGPYCERVEEEGSSASAHEDLGEPLVQIAGAAVDPDEATTLVG